MTLLSILIIIISIAMGFFVLIQESKGGGLASNFASSNQIMGVHRTTDLVEKITWGLAIAIMVLCLVCAFLSKREYDASHENLQATEAQAPAQDAEE